MSAAGADPLSLSSAYNGISFTIKGEVLSRLLLSECIPEAKELMSKR